MSQQIKMPRFARDRVSGDLRTNISCHQCHTMLREENVTFVGVGRDNDGSICFSYEAVCRKCNRTNTIIDTTRKFTDSNWWEELGRWHEQALEQMGPFDRQKWMGDAIRILIGPVPIQVHRVLHGCKGDVGPILLWIRPLHTADAVCRLESGNRLRKFETYAVQDHMSTYGWNKLKRTPEGASFTNEGKTWFRLTRAEMQDILRDRVFTVIDPATERAMSKSTKQVRNPYARTLAQKGSGKARRSSRDAPQVDS